MYGEEFLDYLGQVRDEGILRKTQNNEGLAQVAIEWFWQRQERHANYVLAARKLLVEVNTPVQLLNIKVDRVIGSGNQKKAERLAATLEARLILLRACEEQLHKHLVWKWQDATVKLLQKLVGVKII